MVLGVMWAAGCAVSGTDQYEYLMSILRIVIEFPWNMSICAQFAR